MCVGILWNPNIIIDGEKSEHRFFGGKKLLYNEKTKSNWKILFCSRQPIWCWNLAQLMYMFPYSVFIFLSAGCQIMSLRRSCVYLVYRVKGSFALISHHEEVQILFCPVRQRKKLWLDRVRESQGMVLVNRSSKEAG